MKKSLIALTLLVFLCGSSVWDVTASAQQDRRVADPSEPLATVNGEKITRADVELRIAQLASMNPEAYEKLDEKQRKTLMVQMLDRLIEKRLLHQEAVKQGIQVSEEEAGRMLREFRRKFSSDEEMEEVLRKGKTSTELRKKDDRNFMMTRKLEAKMMEQIEISENDIENYWEQSRPFLVRDTAKARHILVQTEAEAEEVMKKLKKGERFEELAKQYSQDTGTKDRGGDLGWISKEGVVKEFGEAAFALKVGEVSRPVKTRFGYHIIQVEGKKNKDDQTLEDHREHIRHNLQQKLWLNSKRAEWVDSLKAKAKIWNKLAAVP